MHSHVWRIWSNVIHVIICLYTHTCDRSSLFHHFPLSVRRTTIPLERWWAPNSSTIEFLDGSYQAHKKLTFLWPSPHWRPNWTKYELICRKSKIEQVWPNLWENQTKLSKIQNVQMSISTVSTRPKFKISIKSKYPQKSKKVPKSPQGSHSSCAAICWCLNRLGAPQLRDLEQMDLALQESRYGKWRSCPSETVVRLRRLRAHTGRRFWFQARGQIYRFG